LYFTLIKLYYLQSLSGNMFINQVFGQGKQLSDCCPHFFLMGKLLHGFEFGSKRVKVPRSKMPRPKNLPSGLILKQKLLSEVRQDYVRSQFP